MNWVQAFWWMKKISVNPIVIRWFALMKLSGSHGCILVIQVKDSGLMLLKHCGGWLWIISVIQWWLAVSVFFNPDDTGLIGCAYGASALWIKIWQLLARVWWVMKLPRLSWFLAPVTYLVLFLAFRSDMANEVHRLHGKEVTLHCSNDTRLPPWRCFAALVGNPQYPFGGFRKHVFQQVPSEQVP